MTEVTPQSAHELTATPQIESTEMTVRKPLLLRAHVARGDERANAAPLEAIEEPGQERHEQARMHEDHRRASAAP